MRNVCYYIPSGSNKQTIIFRNWLYCRKRLGRKKVNDKKRKSWETCRTTSSNHFILPNKYYLLSVSTSNIKWIINQTFDWVLLLQTIEFIYFLQQIPKKFRIKLKHCLKFLLYVRKYLIKKLSIWHQENLSNQYKQIRLRKKPFGHNSHANKSRNCCWIYELFTYK